MKALVQRVNRASVKVNENIISEIGKGICVLIGFSKDDKLKDVDFMARKLVNLRVFEDETPQAKHWCKSVKDKNYEILCASQFTLFCNLKGNKPNFSHAMPHEQAREMFELLLTKMREIYSPDMIKEGKFRTKCEINIVNDGPVTIMIETPNKNKSEEDME